MQPQARPRSRPGRGRRPLVALACAGVILSVLLTAVAVRSGVWGDGAGAAPGPRVLYLTAPGGAVLPDAALVEHGIKVVPSASALQSAFDPAATQGIIIDREALASVDGQWLKQRYRDGVLLVAIGTSVPDLAAAASVDEVLRTLLAEPGGAPHQVPENFALVTDEAWAAYMYLAVQGHGILRGEGYIPLQEPGFSRVLEERLSNARGIVTRPDGARGSAWAGPRQGPAR